MKHNISLYETMRRFGVLGGVSGGMWVTSDFGNVRIYNTRTDWRSKWLLKPERSKGLLGTAPERPRRLPELTLTLKNILVMASTLKPNGPPQTSHPL